MTFQASIRWATVAIDYIRQSQAASISSFVMTPNFKARVKLSHVTCHQDSARRQQVLSCAAKDLSTKSADPFCGYFKAVVNFTLCTRVQAPPVSVPVWFRLTVVLIYSI